MEIIYLLIFLFYIQCASTDFLKVIKDLKNLEIYIRQYIEEKSPSQSLTHLITCYIREGAYTEVEWMIAGGLIPEDLPQYIIDQDLAKGTNAHLCQTYRDITLPNNEKLDFVHFFAVMNGIEYCNSYSDLVAHLVGWGGDVFQLLQDIKNEEGDLNQLMNIAKNYFLIKGGLDAADFVSDLDAPIILEKKSDDNDFSDIIFDYYNSKEYENRINKFIKLTFPSISKKGEFRSIIFKIYSTDAYIKILECKDGIREGGGSCIFAGNIKPQYTEHQKAAVYVFSDYLENNYYE